MFVTPRNPTLQQRQNSRRDLKIPEKLSYGEARLKTHHTEGWLLWLGNSWAEPAILGFWVEWQAVKESCRCPSPWEPSAYIKHTELYSKSQKILTLFPNFQTFLSHPKALGQSFASLAVLFLFCGSQRTFTHLPQELCWQAGADSGGLSQGPGALNFYKTSGPCTPVLEKHEEIS